MSFERHFSPWFFLTFCQSPPLQYLRLLLLLILILILLVMLLLAVVMIPVLVVGAEDIAPSQ